MGLYKYIKVILTILLAIIFLPLAGEFVIELATEHGFIDNIIEHGYFDNTIWKVLAVMNFISSATNNDWFWAAFWFLCGSTTMAWFGSLMRWGNKREVIKLNPEAGFEKPIKPNPFNALIQEFKDCDAEYSDLEEPLEECVPLIFYYMEKMRKGENPQDLLTLARVSPSPLRNVSEFHAEILYVVKCLDAMGYITLQKLNKTRTAMNDYRHGGMFPNMGVRFNKQYIYFVNSVIFHRDNKKITVSW